VEDAQVPSMADATAEPVAGTAFLPSDHDVNRFCVLWATVHASLLHLAVSVAVLVAIYVTTYCCATAGQPPDIGTLSPTARCPAEYG